MRKKRYMFEVTIGSAYGIDETLLFRLTNRRIGLKSSVDFMFHGLIMMSRSGPTYVPAVYVKRTVITLGEKK